MCFSIPRRMVAKLIPNASVFEMKNCSHWPQMEDPETFNKRSLSFLLGNSEAIPECVVRLAIDQCRDHVGANRCSSCVCQFADR